MLFRSFTGTGGVFTADFRVMFPVAGIDRLDEGTEPVEVVQFANSCNFVFDVAGKSVVELAAEDSVAPIDSEESCQKLTMYLTTFWLPCILSHSSSFSASASMSKGLNLVQSSEMSLL